MKSYKSDNTVIILTDPDIKPTQELLNNLLCAALDVYGKPINNDQTFVESFPYYNNTYMFLFLFNVSTDDLESIKTVLGFFNASVPEGALQKLQSSLCQGTASPEEQLQKALSLQQVLNKIRASFFEEDLPKVVLCSFKALEDVVNDDTVFPKANVYKWKDKYYAISDQYSEYKTEVTTISLSFLKEHAACLGSAETIRGIYN